MWLKALPYLLVILLLTSSFFYGMNLGRKLESAKYDRESLNAEQSRDVIEHKAKNLDRDTIVDMLDDGGWLRDQ